MYLAPAYPPPIHLEAARTVWGSSDLGEFSYSLKAAENTQILDYEKQRHQGDSLHL